MQLGWIDFSKTERSKVLSVLDLLQEKGTLDELGIAPVRDGFANRFFPGTSTIQTRAKYFLIIPYAFKELERSGETNLSVLTKALSALEKSCGESFLVQNYKEQGVIGSVALKNGGWVKRPPSDVYWAGLKRYGIFLYKDLSIKECLRYIAQFNAEKGNTVKLGNRNDNAEEHECDDRDAGGSRKIQFWNIPTYSKDWQLELSMSLTSDEAKFLKSRIIENCKGSMIEFILSNNMTEVLECKSFDDLERIIHKFPDYMQRDYYLALDFSHFMYVLRTLYNVIISDGQNVKATEEFERVREGIAEYADVDLNAIIDTLGISANKMLVNFLYQTQNYMSKSDVEGLTKCIRDREIFLKGESRAKTNHAGEFPLDVWFGGGYLDYRFYNAQIIIRDIFEGEVA